MASASLSYVEDTISQQTLGPLSLNSFSALSPTVFPWGSGVGLSCRCFSWDGVLHGHFDQFWLSAMSPRVTSPSMVFPSLAQRGESGAYLWV